MRAATSVEEVRGSRWNDATSTMGAFRCDYCNGINVASLTSDGPPPSTDHAAWMETLEDLLDWHPRPVGGRSYSDVPELVAEAADEAHKCYGFGALRATVQLARSVVEATAKSKGFVKGNLESKIDALRDADLIREHVRVAAHEIRHLGNGMAHGDFVNQVSKEEAAELLALMDEVLSEVFESPARIERHRAERERRKAATGETP